MFLKNKFASKALSVVLTLCMAASICITTAVSSSAATKNDVAVSAVDTTQDVGSDYGLADKVQDGVILHAWNWSYNAIKANLKTIAEQGYTTIQTSPVQTPKEGTSGKTSGGHWWVLYQPASFSIDTRGDNALGSKADLQSMITEAHKYGLKVIVDIVANHLGNKTDASNLCQLAYQLESDIANNWRFHQNFGASDDNAYTVTRGAIGMPDLNTSDGAVQQRALSLLKECVDVGVDGFRFDAAKHIETPSDGAEASQFWPTVINGANSYASSKGKTLYHYGEILNTCGGSRSYGAYTGFMSITDNTTGNNIRHAVTGRNASGAASSHYNSGVTPSKVVLWAESHDTYANDDKESTYVSTTDMNKTWAMVGSRNNATALYLARPNGGGTQLGAADKTAWANPEVKAVNQFHNAFIGQSEYLSSSGSIAYNERGTSGVVLVNVGGTSTSVNVAAKKMAAGTYKDAITGNTFTVSGGQISGQIGSTGVAVVYNAVAPGPSASITPGSQSYKTDTLELTLNYNSEATSGQYSINGGAFQAFTSGQKITIGQGAAYDTVTTVKVKAFKGNEVSKEVEYTYTKVDPAKSVTIYFDNTGYNWSNVYAYVYTGDGETAVSNAVWPGQKMTLDSSLGLYTLEIPENLESGKVIFTESETATTNRYPADQAPGLDIGGQSMKFSSGNKWEAYSPTPKPTTAPPTSPPTDPPTTPGVQVMRGDANGDNVVDLADLFSLQRHLAKVVILTDKNAAAADVTGDGNIDLADIISVQRYIAEFPNTYNIGKYFTIGGGDIPVPTPAQTPAATPAATPAPTKIDDGTKTIYVGLVYYLNDTISPPRIHYWDNNGVSGDATGVSTGNTVSASVGGNYWGGEAQTFNVYEVKVPSTATGAKFRHPSNESDWYGQDITLGADNTCYLLFEYDNQYLNATADYTSSSNPTPTPTPTPTKIDDGTKTIYVGLVYYLNDTISPSRIHYWDNNGVSGDATGVSTGNTVSASVGGNYWGGEAQTFNVYEVKVPSTATGVKFRHPSNENDWYGQDITLGSDNTCHLLFEYDNQYLNATTNFTP